MTIPVNEQETVITFMRDDETAKVYTSDKTVMTKLDKMVDTSPDSWKLETIDYSKADHEILSKTYIVSDKSLISFRTRKSTRELTPEQRAAYAERSKIMQEARKAKKNASIQD